MSRREGVSWTGRGNVRNRISARGRNSKRNNVGINNRSTKNKCETRNKFDSKRRNRGDNLSPIKNHGLRSIRVKRTGIQIQIQTIASVSGKDKGFTEVGAFLSVGFTGLSVLCLVVVHCLLHG